MKVEKVTLKNIGGTYCCMGDNPPGVNWTDFLPESRKWFKQNLGRHVDGYHLLDDGKVVGHIYYSRSQKALVPFEVEPNVAFIYCTEVLRDQMRKGYGTMMFNYAKNDLKKRGFKGILVDASTIPEYMHYNQFAKQGFKLIREHGMFRLMYFPLWKEHVDVNPIEVTYKPSRDKVEVTLFKHSFCPVGMAMYSLIKKVAQSFGDKVRLVEIKPTLSTIRKYGTTDPLINGKVKILGPSSEENVRSAIQEEIDKQRS
ncbi:MAG: GNAT family N-acetyltransferase [Candidatus Atabeyarchaeum deiterrae]